MEINLSEYELDIIRSAAGLSPKHPVRSGARFATATAYLRSRGFLNKETGEVTEKGLQAIGRDHPAKPINRINRADVETFDHRVKNWPTKNDLNTYQRIATQSAIYPGQGTPFGLMYAALGLAEAGEVQNKVKKAFRDDGVMIINESDTGRDGRAFRTVMRELSPERRAQIIKELGGVLWYIAAVCNEINASMSEVALQNLEELCSRGERGTLQGDGDNR